MKFEYDFSLGTESDLTGKKVAPGEPVIHFKGMVFRMNEIEEFSNKLNKKDFCSHNIRKVKKHELCDRCEKISNYKFMKKDDHTKNFCVCDNCLSEIKEKALKFRREVKKRLLYWDSNGLNLYNYKSSDKNFVNCVTGDIIERGKILTISFNNKDDYLAIELKNVGDFCYRLEDNGKNSEYNYHRHNRDRKTPYSLCDMCGDWLWEDETSPFCRSCEERFLESIDKFLEDCSKEILPELI